MSTIPLRKNRNGDVYILKRDLQETPAPLAPDQKFRSVTDNLSIVNLLGNTYLNTLYNPDLTDRALVYPDPATLITKVFESSADIQVTSGDFTFFGMPYQQSFATQTIVGDKFQSVLSPPPLPAGWNDPAPASYDPRAYMPEILNQGVLGSCYANAVASIFAINQAHMLKTSGYTDQQIREFTTTLLPSRSFLEYTSKRYINIFTTFGYSQDPLNQGGNPILTAYFASLFGIPLESQYEYPELSVYPPFEQAFFQNKTQEYLQDNLFNPQVQPLILEFVQKFAYAPGAFVMSEAEVNPYYQNISMIPVGSPNDYFFYGLDPGFSSDDRITLIKYYLRNQKAVTFCFDVAKSWVQAGYPEIVSLPLSLDDIEGGHAVVLVGYVDADTPYTGYFIMRNSWGTTYGDGGYFKLPYDWVEWLSENDPRQLTNIVTFSFDTV